MRMLKLYQNISMFVMHNQTKTKEKREMNVNDLLKPIHIYIPVFLAIFTHNKQINAIHLQTE